MLWTAAGQTGVLPSLNFLSDRNLRTWIRGGEITGPATTVRVHLRGPNGGPGTTVDHATIGPRADNADFTGAPITLTFGGATNVFLPAGVTVVSDPLALAWSPDEDYLVALYLEGGEYVTQWTGIGQVNAWGRSLAQDQAGFVQVSGYYPHSSVYFVEAVEGITGDPGTPTPTLTPTWTSTSTWTSTPTPTPTETSTPTPTPSGTPVAEWETAWSAGVQTGVNPSVNSLAGRNYRNVIRGDVIGKTCTEVRLVLRAPSPLSSTELDHVVIAPAAAVGDVFDYTGPGAVVTFGGASTVVIPAGATVTSDPISLPFAPGQDYIVALFHDDRQVVAQWRGSETNSYLRPTTVDEAVQPDVAGYYESICLYALEAIEGR